MSQMNDGTSGYKAETQHGQISDWVSQLVERQGLYPCIGNVAGAFERVLAKVLSMVINGALTAPRDPDGKVFGKLDPERAGIVMFRY